MNKPPVKHNPAFLSDEELVRAFVVRHDDRDMILGVIKENTTDSNQHVLVIGPRGIGKTMLVRRVALNVQQDEPLCHQWYPVIFAEESYEVASAGEFWLEALFHLGHQTGDSKWTRTYEDLKREPVETRLHDRALAQLMDFADSQDKRILLIVENLNMILGEQLDDDNAWKLRHTLMHEPRVMLLATATTRMDLPENTHKAMFEMFKTQVLRPLNDAECQALWLSATGDELGSRRIRAVSILTGGNPRLLTIISRFGARLSFAELMDDMTGLVDDHTDYFKSHLDALPPTERKAYVALADLWDPSTARDVALASRLGVSMTSSLLKRLVSRGAVIENTAKGRTKRYQVAERMYNIYYLMRRRGSPSERVRAVVQFMVKFYEERELVDAAKRLAAEACRLSREDRQCHYYAYEGIVKTAPSDLRSKIMSCTPRAFLEAPDRSESWRQWLGDSSGAGTCPCESHSVVNSQISELLKKGWKARREDRREDARQLLQDAIVIDATCPAAWLMLARIESEVKGREQEAERAFRKASELGNSDPCIWDDFGRFLARRKGRQDEAEQAFRKALEIYPDCSDAWLGLARLFSRKSGKKRDAARAYREAEEACVRRLTRYPRQASGWRMLARIRHEHTSRFAEAEMAYRKALEIDPGNVLTWTELGLLLAGRLNRHDEAEAAYRKAIELDPHSTSALGNLACLLRDHQGKHEEAEALLLKIVEIDQSHADAALMDLGILYEQRDRFADAEAAYRKAITLNPKHICPWVCVGTLLYRQLKRYAEAETAYRKALEINPKHKIALGELGRLLRDHLSKHEEAEALFRRIIELRTSDRSLAWRDLTELELIRHNDSSRALEIAGQAITDLPTDATLLNGLAWKFYDSGSPQHLTHAEAWARKAVELAAANLAFIHTLACILARDGKEVEALQWTGKVLDDVEFVKKNIDDMVRLFAELVAVGDAKQAYQLLRDSKSSTALEPVSVALQLHLGMEVFVAPEIAEVAKDVLKRFEGAKVPAVIVG